MSLAKRYQHILMFGDVNSRYLAARNLILISAHRQIKILGKDRKKVFGSLIHDYCLRYGLRKRKLGLMIAKPDAKSRWW